MAFIPPPLFNLIVLLIKLLSFIIIETNYNILIEPPSVKAKLLLNIQLVTIN